MKNSTRNLLKFARQQCAAFLSGTLDESALTHTVEERLALERLGGALDADCANKVANMVADAQIVRRARNGE